MTALWADVLPGALALLPAVLTWLWGRSLLSLGDDPALAERLLAHRQRVLQVVVATAVVLGVAAPDALVWTLPLLLIARAAAALPLRRALLGETWTLWQYLTGGVRLYLAWLGFWILLAFSPTLIQPGGWQAAVIVAGVLVAWNHWYAAILLRLLDARLLADEALATRFAAVVRRSGVKAPRVWRAGPPGAVIANALALPGLGQASVLFSETLLERLSPEEVTAIFAHEVAHLEQYPPSRLRRLYLGVLLLIALGTGLVPMLGDLVPWLTSPLQLAWPIVVVVFLLVRARGAQANEYAGDRRGAELVGDVESLVNGLLKLHAITLLPRRWEQEMERSASHPSLARRIQALRGTPQSGEPPLERPAVFLAAQPGVVVAFDSDCLRQYWDVPVEDAGALEALDRTAGSSRSVRYDRLVELRVAARGTAPPELIVVARDGRRQRVPMRAPDLECLQRILDRVDPLLSPSPPGLVGTRPLARIAALVGALTALLGAQLWSVVLVTLLAAWRPGVRLLLAAAIAYLAATLLVLCGQTIPGQHGAILAAGAVLVAGVALWMRRHAGAETGPPTEPVPVWLVAGLAAVAVVAWAVPVAMAQGSLLRLTQTLGMGIGASILPLAVAVLLAQDRSTRSRWGAAALGLAAGAPIMVGSTWFRDQVVRDPLLGASPALVIEDAALSEVGRFAVGPWASRVRVSPNGTRVAVAEGEPDEESEGPFTIRVYAVGSDPQEVEATDVQFLDDTRLVTLRTSPAGLAIGVQALEDPAAAPWQLRLPGLRTGRLALDPGTGRWRVLGEARDGRLVRFEGQVAENTVERTEWPPPATSTQWTLQGFAGSGATALWLNQERGGASLGGLGPWLSSLAGYWPVRSTLYAADQSKPSLLADSEAEVTCLDPPIGEEVPVCLASDGSQTQLLAVDVRTGSTRSIGSLRGRVWPSAIAPGPVLIASWKGGPVLVHLNRQRLLRLRQIDTCGASEAAYAPDLVALVIPGRTGSTITLYRLGDSGDPRARSPGDTGTAVRAAGETPIRRSSKDQAPLRTGLAFPCQIDRLAVMHSFQASCAHLACRTETIGHHTHVAIE